MEVNLAKMWLMLFVITATFNIALNAYQQPQIQGVNTIDNLTTSEPNPVYGFLGPLIIIWDFIKSLFNFINAPWRFLVELGAPSEVMTLFAVPWTGIWIFGLASFIRGFKP